MQTSEGSDEYALPITSGGVVRLTSRLRERYLTEDVDEAIVQATGRHLTITVWSDNDNIEIKIPFDGWRGERLYERSISSWGVNVARWTTPGKYDDGEGVGWFNDASIEVNYGGDSGKEMVRATVETFEGERP